MVDLVRDPRWGRVLESPGEDPFYNGRYAAACVEGFQGALDEHGAIDSAEHIASCVKHFAAYGAVEGGREYNTVDMSKRRLYEFYLPAYKAAVKAGAKLVMTSFNTIDGIPATGNQWLNREVLRKEWGFDRVLISDASAVIEMTAHGVAADESDAVEMAIRAGVDIDMLSPAYIGSLKRLVTEGRIEESLIDEAVLRVLHLKNDMGLFENPYAGADERKEKELLLCKEHRDSARKLAEDSCVLLKNTGILPLKRGKDKIALIGPYADNRSILGIWAIHADMNDTVTVKEGLENILGADVACDILKTARGCYTVRNTSDIQSFGSVFEIEDETKVDEEKLFSEAMQIAQESDVIILALGEHFLQSGEGGSRGDIRLPDGQRELLYSIRKLRKPVITLLFSGRPMDIRDITEYSDAVMECWFPGTEGGNAIARLLFGIVNPSGKLTMSFPYSVGQVPVYYNEYHTGRPYKPEYEKTRFGSKYTDIPNAPLFPFGYGLSYTSYSYQDLRLSSSTMKTGETIEGVCTVKNIGECSGREIVQLYIQDKVGSVVRPIRELKGFKKISLEPEEEKEVKFVISEEMLRFYTVSGEYKAEPGEFTVYIGSDSTAGLSKTFWLSDI